MVSFISSARSLLIENLEKPIMHAGLSPGHTPYVTGFHAYSASTFDARATEFCYSVEPRAVGGSLNWKQGRS